MCPICKGLEGYTWIIKLGNREFAGLLVHPVYGDVWDVNAGSMAHGHRGHCRCWLTHTVDLSDLVEKVAQLREQVLAMVPKGERSR